jgi:hypothetical protein
VALDAVASEILADHPNVILSKVVVDGQPGLVLLEVVQRADLLVVDSRGHGPSPGCSRVR